MATKQIGIRELKEQAPRVVQRASDGERIVITRHGKPVAVLSPLSPEDEAEDHPSLVAWKKEKAAFERLLPKLGRYRGSYVAVAGGKVVGQDDDHEALYECLRTELGGRVFFIGRVGAAPPVVDMPGFEIQ